MTKMRLYQLLPLLITALLISRVSNAQAVTVTGNNWTLTPTVTEAGKDYTGTYESAANQILITAHGPLLLGSMKLTAHYEGNPDWNNAIGIAIKRNGTGTSICLLCAISGNENYIALGTTDVTLYTMTTPLLLTTYSNINMQLKLSGVSVTVPATNYAAKIVFTIGSN